MRIAKSIVGWLSIVSLLLSIGLSVYWVYRSALPWLEGAAFYRLPEPDMGAMARLFSKESVGPSDNKMLRDLAAREVSPDDVRSGWDAFAWSWGHRRLPIASKPTSLTAAAILDENGRVVAAHPKALIGQVFPFNHTLEETRDSEGGLPASEIYPYWSAIFSQTVARLVNEPVAGRVYMQRIRNPAGKTIAVLAVVARDEVVVPALAGSRPSDLTYPDSLFGYAALLLFFAHGFLMIAWVSMDAGWRGMRPFAWGTLAFFTGWVGLGAYLMARLPAPGECPNCGETILSRYVRCPACGVSLMAICPICHARGKPGWQFCPVCGTAPTQSGASPPLQTATPVSTPAGSGLAALQVCVLDADSGGPVPNVRVSINGPSFREGFTGDKGVFNAQRLRAGRYTVAASRPGHEPASAELELCEGSAEVVELRLKAQPGRIVGRVVERATGRPMAGVTVSLESGRLDRSAVTGDEGGFVLEDMPGGPYTIRAEAEGFVPQVKLAEVPPGQQAALDFSLDRAEESAAEARVEGETTDAKQ